LLADGCGKERQAAGYEQGRAHSLEGAGGDEGLGRRRDAAQRRRRRECSDADHEHATASVLVAERASEEQECRERHEIGVEHPLEVGEVGVQVLRDRRKRDVDDRAVEERDPRAQDRCDEHPPGDRRSPRLHISERYRAVG
jgi:hypothetical protein